MNGAFAVSQSQRVDEQLAGVLAILERRVDWNNSTNALRWIFEELSRTPMEFGESRNDLLHLDLHLRIAFVKPFCVDFAVHVLHHKVFIQRWSLRKP